jgi:hypothetical protein
MKKQAVRNSVLAVALGAVIVFPTLSRAESFDEYNASFKKDLPKVDALLKGATPGNSVDSLREAISANLAQAADGLQLGGARKELFEEEAKLQNWHEKIKKANALGPAMDAFVKKAVSERSLKLDKAQDLTSQLSASTPFINPADFDVSGLANSCQNGVDFSPLLQMAQNFGTDKVDYLRRKAQVLLEEKSEDAKALEKKKILDLIANLKELNAKNEELDAEALKPEELGKLDSIQAIEARLAKLKTEKNPQAKAQFKQLESDLVGKFQGFTEQLFQIRDNDKRVQQLGDEFARGIEQQQQFMMMIAQQATTRLVENCVQETDGIFQEIDTARIYMSPIVGSRVAALDAQAQEQRANSMGFIRGDYTNSCPDVSTTLQGTIGGFFNTDLPNQLQAVRSTKNPAKMLTEAIGVMDSIRNMQAQLGPALQPLMEGCDTASKIRDSLRQRTQNATQPGSSRNASTVNPGVPRNTTPTTGFNNGVNNGFGSIPTHSVRR